MSMQSFGKVLIYIFDVNNTHTHIIYIYMCVYIYIYIRSTRRWSFKQCGDGKQEECYILTVQLDAEQKGR